MAVADGEDYERGVAWSLRYPHDNELNSAYIG